MPSLAATRKLAKQETKLVLNCKFQLLVDELQIGPASLIKKLIVQDALSCVVMPLMPLHTKAQKGRRKKALFLEKELQGFHVSLAEDRLLGSRSACWCSSGAFTFHRLLLQGC